MYYVAVTDRDQPPRPAIAPAALDADPALPLRGFRLIKNLTADGYCTVAHWAHRENGLRRQHRSRPVSRVPGAGAVAQIVQASHLAGRYSFVTSLQTPTHFVLCQTVLLGLFPPGRRGAGILIRLVDVAGQTGVTLMNICGGASKDYIVEVNGNGAAFFDYDNDGDMER